MIYSAALDTELHNSSEQIKQHLVVFVPAMVVHFWLGCVLVLGMQGILIVKDLQYVYINFLYLDYILNER